MTDKWTRSVIAIIARTVLRCERHILRNMGGKTENDVLTHNDECIRLRGLMEEA